MKNSDCLSRLLIIFLSLFVVLPIAQAGDTLITGGRMEIKNQGDQVYFYDGVTLERDQDILKALQMETNGKRDKVFAKGNVEFYRRISATETSVGYGDHSYYNSQSGDGYLLGITTRAHVIYTQILTSTQSQKIDIFSDRFDFYKSCSTVFGQGNIYGYSFDVETGDFYEFWSEKAEFIGDKKIVKLFGQPQPRSIQSNGENKKYINGNILIFDLVKKEFISEGNSRVIFFEASAKASKK